jgi:hypothetical protein
MRIDAGIRIVGETGGPWAEFADRLSERVRARSGVYALRNIVWKLTERPEDLISQQLSYAGSAARRLLEAAWTRQYDRGLVVTALEAVCDTYQSDHGASAALIRQALQPDHIRQHGFEEMPHLCSKVGRIIDADPNFAAEIYRAVFGYEEESTEANPLGSGRLLGLISNRRQDYRHSWWILAKEFPKFLESNPVQATRALIGALEGYVTRKHRTGSERARTATFRLGDASARIREDHSYVWVPRDREPYEDAERMLGAFSGYLHTLAKKDDPGQRFHEIQSVTAENELAAIWAALIHAAADAPQTFAASLVELVSAPAILTWPDTHYAAARYLENAYPTLSDVARAAIERAIVGLPSASEAERAIRLRLAGYLPAERIVTEEARELRAEAEDANAVRKSEPLFRITSWGGTTPSLSEQLTENGVDTSLPANQHLIRLIEPVREFALEHRDEKLDLEAFRSSLPALCVLRDGILEAQATPEVIYEALDYLAEAAANAVRVKAVASDNEIAEFLRAVFIFAARGNHPAYDPESEAQFARSPGWGSPAARIEAARGLMNFICWRRHEFDSLRPIADELARDPVAAVRFQIAKRLPYFYRDQSEWVRYQIAYFIREDANTSLIREALYPAPRLKGA